MFLSSSRQARTVCPISQAFALLVPSPPAQTHLSLTSFPALPARLQLISMHLVVSRGPRSVSMTGVVASWAQVEEQSLGRLKGMSGTPPSEAGWLGSESKTSLMASRVTSPPCLSSMLPGLETGLGYPSARSLLRLAPPALGVGTSGMPW